MFQLTILFNYTVDHACSCNRMWDMSTVSKNGSSAGENRPFLIHFFLHRVGTIDMFATNIAKIVQTVEVASEREDELETKGMDQCTMIHSNFHVNDLLQSYIHKTHLRTL